MRTTSFERLCRDLVTVVLASATTAACGGAIDSGANPSETEGESGPGTTPADEFISACVGNDVVGLAGYTPEPAVDYLARREETQPYAPEEEETEEPADFDPASMTVRTSSEHGTPCATATDAEACLRALADLRVVQQEADCTRAQTGCYAGYLVYTRGDEIGVLRSDRTDPATKGAWRAFFGAIDTPAEAFWLATMEGLQGRCFGPAESQAQVRRAGDALEIVVIKSGCNTEEERVVLRVHPDGRQEVVSRTPLATTGFCAGRRPDGYRVQGGVPCSSAVGAYLAVIAELEDAAVHAFGIMADELEDAGAPTALIASARAAQEDEVRHARAMTALARRRGGAPRRADAPARAQRSLVDMAIENAVEGCVRETYAALVTLFQAERAADPEVRKALAPIAVDEVAHAALSLRVGAWLSSQLDEASRAAVAEARRRAMTDLAAELSEDLDPELRRAVGLPSAAEAQALLRATTGLSLA
jgi:hypothetical protein